MPGLWIWQGYGHAKVLDSRGYLHANVMDMTDLWTCQGYGHARVMDMSRI
jgi:hypothetical protein